jgi:hypothetical protein
MSALSAVETPVAAADGRSAAGMNVPGGARRLRVVGGSAPTFAVRPAGGTDGTAQPRSSSIADAHCHRVPILTGRVVVGRGQRSASAANTLVSPAPLRLTRRGRIVVAVLLVAVLSVLVLMVTALASGHAQATNHGEPRAGYQGMHEVVVRPGQTLWSIAAAAQPTADLRNVVQQIMSANALGSPSISVGQLLWVP